jgi:hypothetical protein
MDIEPKPIYLKTFITSEAYKTKVESIRAGSTEAETKERKNKANLPCVTISGRFNTHRSISDLKEPTGLICVDIDYKDNKQIMDKVPSILSQISNVAFYAKSVSGTGYYAIIPIRDGDKLLNHFWALERDFKDMGIKIDKACKDYTRLRLASYDTNYWINTGKVEAYNKVLDSEYKEHTEPKKEPKEVKRTKVYSANTINIVDSVLKDCQTGNVDITREYEDWNKVCLALISMYKDSKQGREYFHAFSKLNKSYNETECNEQYNKMLLYLDKNDVNISSLSYLFDKYSKNE